MSRTVGISAKHIVTHFVTHIMNKNLRSYPSYRFDPLDHAERSKFVQGRVVRSIGVATMMALVVGCYPSTNFETKPIPVTSRADQTSPATQSFFDSLRKVRDTERADTSSSTLWSNVPLAMEQSRDLAWLNVLQDTQLVALVRMAVSNNSDIRMAQARVREYRAELNVARSPFYPQLSANGAGGRNKVPFPGANPVASNYVRATADLSWELDFWGRIRKQSQAASFDLKGREEDMRATVLSLVSDVVNGYLQLREIDENLLLAEQTLESRQTTLDIARRRFAQELISELDVRQFEAQVAEPAARVADFLRLRREQENALSLLLGVPPGSIARGGNLNAVISGISVPDSLPGDLVTRRPDVMRVQRDYQAARARIGVASANRFPPITITGQYGSQRDKFKGLFNKQSEIYTVQLGVSLPLFTGGRVLNQERVARARAEQVDALYEKTLLNALREASNALAGVRLGRDQLIAQETQVRALQVAYDIVQRRYSAGISSYLEVLDAQRSLFAAQLAFVQSERQYLSSIVSLYRAIGGSWEGRVR